MPHRASGGSSVRGIFIEEEDALKYSKKLWKCVITMGCHIDMVGYLKAFTQLSQTLKIPKEKDDDGR